MELVCFLLKQGGFEVLQARDGRQGLDMAYNEHPAMILLDMSIPEIDGWKVARRLKDDPTTRNMIIVALTGHTAPGDRKRALSAGCDGYISKPFDASSFVEQVTGFLNRNI
jgi:two-component system cell cycle response regulator DivK